MIMTPSSQVLPSIGTTYVWPLSAQVFRITVLGQWLLIYNNNFARYVSPPFPVDALDEKEVTVLLGEVCAGAVTQFPGTLHVWVETCYFADTTAVVNGIQTAGPPTWSYFTAIGGGGGPPFRVPLVPVVVVPELIADGQNLHTIVIPWNMHSKWARLCVQLVAAGAGNGGYWTVLGLFSGRSS